MHLMLAVIFLCVGLGLFVRRFGWREQLLVVVMATAMTGLYYFGQRFM